MRDISEETRIIMNTRRNFVNYARVVLHDGTVLNLTPSDFRISGNSFTDDWNDGEDFQLGSAIGKTATLLLDNTDNRVDNTFTLQTSEPGDWATNYGDYYTYDGSAYYPIMDEVAPTWVADTYYTLTSSISYPHGKFSDYDFYMSYFELKVVLPKSHHDGGELVDTELFIGTFTVTTPASHGATIEITGVDNMYMFDKSFDECTLDFNTNPTLQVLLARCCADCGVALYSSDFTNKNLTVSNKPQNVTYRQVISYIAQIAGCNAKIIPSGALKLQYYDMSVFNDLDGGEFDSGTPLYITGDTADGGSFNPWNTGYEVDGGDFGTALDYHNLVATNGTSVSTDDIQFTGVEVGYTVEEDGNSVTKYKHYPNTTGWDNYTMQIVDNPFVTSDNADLIANTTWDAVRTLKFRVFSCSSLQDPTIEAGDCALVYDVKGNMYKTVITNITFKTGGMTDVKCTAQSPVSQNNRYVSSAAKAVTKAREEMNSYNAMVAHFNEIANQALGYKETTISGVKYYYSGDTLASSQNVVMINANGVFISDNYNDVQNRSWNSGVDITTATMLMNLVYVHGVEADWVNCQRLSALSANMGTVYVGGGSNGNGVLYVRNASNNTIVTLSNTGIDIDNGDINLGNGVFHVTNGGALTATSADIKGTVKATSGFIGSDTSNGWNITATGLYNGCSGVDVDAVGTYVGKNGIRNQSDTGTNKKYVQIKNGKLTANNVDIDGGDINMSSGAFHVSSSGHMTCNHVTITGTGGTATSNAINLGSGLFKVTNGGDLTAKSGTIAGFVIKDDSLGDPNNTSNSVGMKKGNYLFAWTADYKSEVGFGRIRVSTGSQSGRGIYVYAGSDFNGNYILHTHSTVYSNTHGDVAWQGSDKRYKKNIEDLPLDFSQEIILKLRPRQFEFKTQEGERYGFIAQEVRASLDEMGCETSRLEYVSEEGDMCQLNYSDIIAPLVKVVQKQQEEINDLKERLAKLESIVNAKQ